MQADCGFERHKEFEKFLRGKAEGMNIEDKKTEEVPAITPRLPFLRDGDESGNYGNELGV